jgi:excisionase family DNA binding protein
MLANIKSSEVCPHCGNEISRNTQSFDELKEKPFLSIAETCKLIGISRRTVYRMLERGELIAGKAGKRTILRRSDLDKLFEKTETKAAKTLIRKPSQSRKQQEVKSELPKSLAAGNKVQAKQEAASQQSFSSISNQLNLFES